MLSCSISGTVIDAVTGLPLGKVEVLAERSGVRNDPNTSTTTDATGKFTMVDIDPGQYRLSA